MESIVRGLRLLASRNAPIRRGSGGPSRINESTSQTNTEQNGEFDCPRFQEENIIFRNRGTCCAR